MEAQTVITLEGRATKNFTIATVTLLLAFFTLLLIIHTDRTVQLTWLVLSLWLEFAICITASFLCWAKTIKSLKQVTQENKNVNIPPSFQTGFLRKSSFVTCSGILGGLLPTNIFNLPNISDQWMDDAFNLKLGIAGLTVLIILVDVSRSSKNRNSGSDQRINNTSYAGTFLLKSANLYVVQMLCMVGLYFTYDWFYLQHLSVSKYWILETTSLSTGLLIVLVALGIQVLILTERISFFRAVPALQH